MSEESITPPFTTDESFHLEIIRLFNGKQECI